MSSTIPLTNVEPSQVMKQLQVVVERVGDSVVARPRGEIDMSSAHVLREQLRNAFDDGPKTVIVDLSEAELLDSSGLGVLVATARRARVIKCGFCLVAPTPSVSRVLTLTALDRVWPIYPSLAEALAAP